MADVTTPAKKTEDEGQRREYVAGYGYAQHPSEKIQVPHRFPIPPFPRSISTQNAQRPIPTEGSSKGSSLNASASVIRAASPSEISNLRQNANQKAMQGGNQSVTSRTDREMVFKRAHWEDLPSKTEIEDSLENQESRREESLSSALKKDAHQVRQCQSDHEALFHGGSHLLERRSPFVHNPPYPEERRQRISHPRTAKDYIINLREDLADFQESRGLPRTRDYSFLSLGMALTQETGRAIFSILLLFTELFPIIGIISLILRFSLDKLIDIMETDGAFPRVKKSLIFASEIFIIMIPLWILVGTIIIPLTCLILSMFGKLFRITDGKKKKSKQSSRSNQIKPIKN